MYLLQNIFNTNELVRTKMINEQRTKIVYEIGLVMKHEL